MSPVVTLLALVAGLALAVVILGTLLSATLRGRPIWILVALGVVLAVLVAPLPAAVRDRANAANDQRRADRAYDEQAAHRKCLLDFGRPDLLEVVDLVEANVPQTAEYRFRPQSGVTACLSFNLLPRRPVAPDDFDAERHWLIYDRAVPEPVQDEIEADRSLPSAQRRYLEAQPGLIIARPASQVPR